MTTTNLGVARRALAGQAHDPEAAHAAIADLDTAVGFFRAASHARYFELAEEQLIEALALLEELETP